MYKKITFLFLIALILPLTTFAQEINYYYGAECGFCQQMSEFLETQIAPAYPDLIINKYETWHDQANFQALTEIFDSYKIDPNNTGVPALIIGEELIIGNRQEQVRAAVEKLFAEKPETPATQASAVTTYGAWALVSLVVIGLVFAVVSSKKKKEKEQKNKEIIESDNA